MPTPRVLLLLICPLLLLSLAGPLVAAQPPTALETESRQAADQEALRATVSEQARDLDRLFGKVDGLQTSLDSAAKAGESASRTAQLVVGLLGVAGGLAAGFIALLAFLGYRRADEVARDLTADIEAVGDEAQLRLEEARQCEESVRENAERFDELMKHIEEYRDALQTEARKYQDMVGMSDEEKEALAELAPRLDFLEAFGLPLDPESYLARGNDYYTKGEYERAAQCYGKAAQLRPEYDAAWNNWGNALGEQAKTKDGPEADALFQQAYEKYARAVNINPDLHEAWYNWGNDLLAQANTKEGGAADALFEQAYEKYARVVEIKPDMDEAWCNWGNTLGEQAKTKDGPEADSLFQQAYEKYARAVAIKPDDHEAWNNWGIVLLDQARTKRGAEADALFQQAEEKFEAALGIKPDDADAYFNRACLRVLQGREAEAIADLRKAIELDPSCRDYAKTDKDEDFGSLRSNPDFRKLVGLEPEPDQPAEN